MLVQDELSGQTDARACTSGKLEQEIVPKVEPGRPLAIGAAKLIGRLLFEETERTRHES